MMGTSEQETLELLSLTVEVDEFGSTIYRNSTGQIHRLFGPAWIFSNGKEVWLWRDLWHRVGGPSNRHGDHQLFGEYFASKEAYELECVNKTNPLWKEYDAEIKQFE